jgi:Na+-driven multidrug efflux pump
MLAVLVPILTLLSLHPAFFLRLISKDTPISPASLSFFRLRLIGCLLQCFIFCFRGFYAAHRNNRIFFSVIATSITTHALLTNLLLSGTPWFAPLGIQGLGLSHCLSTFLGLAIYLEQFSHNITVSQISLPTRPVYFSLLKMAIPLSIHGIVDHYGTMLIFTRTGHFFGLLPLAGLHLISSIQGISPGAGFGLTALTEVTKAHAHSPEKSQRTGWAILLAGIGTLGGLGLFASFMTSKILQIVAPGNIDLQTATTLPLQIMLASLGLHVGCQIILKMLQAVDRTIPSVSINLLFVYGFRTPLLFMLGYFSSASLATVLLILTSEKLLKLSAMLLYWQKTYAKSNNILTPKLTV